MKRARISVPFVVLVVATLIFGGCAGVDVDMPTSGVPEEPAGGEAELYPTAAATPLPQSTATPASEGAVGRPLPIAQPRPNRLIIKNAEMSILVSDTDDALDRLTLVVGDVGGYMLSSRVWYEEREDVNYKYATVTMGVPVDQFETTLRRLRQLAVRVIDETASGQDVTDEYVDLDSRLRNLEATRDRIRQFLDQAETVEEALRVNEQLKAVEAEIEQVQGRMNYLFDRAGYSTIAVQLKPEVAPLPTPSPTPTPAPWNAGAIARDASATLGSVLKALAEIGIWLTIVVLPLVLPPVALVALIGWFVRRLSRGREEERETAPA